MLECFNSKLKTANSKLLFIYRRDAEKNKNGLALRRKVAKRTKEKKTKKPEVGNESFS